MYTEWNSKIGFSAAPKHRNSSILSGLIFLILGYLRSANFESFRVVQNRFLRSLRYNWNPNEVILCSRGWKIKAVVGAILIGAGAVVTPFNPAVGTTMITTGASMVVDGTIGAVDEDDARKNSMRHSENNKKTQCWISDRNSFQLI